MVEQPLTFARSKPPSAGTAAQQVVLLLLHARVALQCLTQQKPELVADETEAAHSERHEGAE